jgi:2-keto-4-pentenoate hydratase/2-oxohepta-3-ene-1,7-dioic acid hydratase in catechol pathway
MTTYKLATYEAGQGPRAGLIVGDTLFDIAEATGRSEDASTRALIRDWDNAKPRLAKLAANPGGKGKPLASVKLLTPLPEPGTIYCAGANYTDHVAEMAAAMKMEPDPDPHTLGLTSWHFIKAAGSVVGPNETVHLPRRSKKVDWEAELGAVIGRKATNVSLEEAMSYVAGYLIGNDLSARDFTRRDKVHDLSPFKFDWVGHKNFDGACPLGPWIVPADAIADPQKLAISLSVNGVMKQNSNTSSMIFTLAEQVSDISKKITLHPGDIILTGTPAGVGTPKGEFLQPGDDVVVAIEGIGELRNKMA